MRFIKDNLVREVEDNVKAEQLKADGWIRVGIEEVEKVEDIGVVEVEPEYNFDKMKKDEIIEELIKKGIEFDKTATKEKLFSLLV